MFDDGAVAVAKNTPPKGYAIMSDEEFEEYKRYKEQLVKRLWELREEAHRKGMRYLTQEECDEIWAEERAGGEGFNRVWNY